MLIEGTEESLLVLRTLGIQTQTLSSSYLLPSTVRFIPTSQIRDIFIHEAFRGFEVRYYLAIVVEGESEVVVVFPVSQTLHERDLLLIKRYSIYYREGRSWRKYGEVRENVSMNLNHEKIYLSHLQCDLNVCMLVNIYASNYRVSSSHKRLACSNAHSCTHDARQSSMHRQSIEEPNGGIRRPSPRHTNTKLASSVAISGN